MKRFDTTALGYILVFINREGRMPEVREFLESGYCRSSYYKARDKYYDYIKARVEEKQEGGNPVATYEDDIAEGFINGD